MPRLAVDESIVALEIYKGLASSGTISVAALGDRTGLAPSRIEEIVSPWPGIATKDATSSASGGNRAAGQQARATDQRSVPLRLVCLGLPLHTSAPRSVPAGEFGLPSNRRTN